MSADITAQANTQPGGELQLSCLAFVALCELDQDVFRGGVLVTDSRGKPIEFRCTSAIQPNNVQKTLYGSTLRTHMAVELAGRPLLSVLKEKPKVVLVKQDEFLELRPFIDLPVLLVAKQGETIAVDEENAKTSKQELLPSPTGKFDPVVLTCHWEYKDDMRSILAPLSGLFTLMDITEPFSRICNALKLLQEKGALPNK
ncbi:MAG: hypothetical protein HYV35_06170 [Lentisphaerae bacterium]|nr:hypothetical protein [Lentisphaerota bacterium]